MAANYTAQKNTLNLIALLKAHGIRKFVVSPGTTNIALVASIQSDPFFEVISSVDERSAAYIACGMAAESGEPVCLSCTGATASRNYAPGLTEAFYRKLPILAITCTHHLGRVGQNIAQVIDRSIQFNDIVKLSITLTAISSSEDEWAQNVAINRALLELKHHGGGPVHINLVTESSLDFSVTELPKVRKIERLSLPDEKIRIPDGRIAVFVGQHEPFCPELTEAVDTFCAVHDAIVLCDQTSNYRGKYRCLMNLVPGQGKSSNWRHYDLLIDIGNISGAYSPIAATEVWRVNPDGEIRDKFHTLRFVFELDELSFFRAYGQGNVKGHKLLDSFREDEKRIIAKIPEIPFSNIYMAKQLATKLPENSFLHLAILNSLRAWNLFETPNSVAVYSNTGGFGIDGCLSTAIGGSLVNPDRLHFLVIGDLAFFYDMNSIGNRFVGKNIRILLVNNGVGTEFKNYSHPASAFGKNADPFVAARGHFGNQSQTLVKDYATSLGFKYKAAKNKDEFLSVLEEFTNPEIGSQSVLLEAFTNDKDESDALKAMLSIEPKITGSITSVAKKIIGDKGFAAIKKALRK